MAGVYVKTNPEKGEKIINELLNEYQTQKTYLELVPNLEGKELSKGVSVKENRFWEESSISHEFDDKNTKSDTN